jgi:hypothetical protein
MTKNIVQPLGTIVASLAVTLAIVGSANAQAPKGVGTEEFGLTPRQLVSSIETVEGLISRCMRKHGFQYIAADYDTVRKGMTADKNIPGLSEEEFIKKYGFGVSTMYTGKPPQLSKGYNPARVGLGERNVRIFQNLSPADRVAYNRTLLGENTGQTLAVAIETENFSRTGGCTREAIGKVFKPEQMAVSYYNPKDDLINKDRRMRAALRYYRREMRKAGFDYNHPDEVEPDIRARTDALTRGGTIPIERMSPKQRAALKELQIYELRVAAKNYQMAQEIFDPVEERIEKELYSRKVQ